MKSAVDYSRVAEVYDALVSFEADIPLFLELCGQVDGRVLELMSGTGLVSLPLAAEGVDLTCVDSSPEMLQVLQSKLGAEGLKITVLEQDVTRLQFENTFDLALLPFNSFEELVEIADRKAAIEAIYRALKPGGHFLCTLHNAPVAVKSLPQGPTVVAKAAIDEREISMLLDVRHDSSTGIVEGTETILERSSKGESLGRDDLPLRYVLIEEAEFRRLVQRTGFSISALFGDYDRSPFAPNTSPSMIWTLQK